MSRKYLCPVCGFDKLKELPYGVKNAPSYEICPCCGFEFGFDGDKDQDVFKKFRKLWIDNGANWFTPGLKPNDWNLQKQLENLYRKN